jgi:hypothetical protein
MARVAEAESLRRCEEAARTEAEFRELCELYDRLDANRERRERAHEVAMGDDWLLDAPNAGRARGADPVRAGAARGDGFGAVAVVPQPLVTEHWREVMRGDFISAIYDGADVIWQVFGDWQIGRLIKNMKAKQRDVLFRSAVRGCPAEQIAECTGKTSRGVNKLIAAALANVRAPLAAAIRRRVDGGLPVTLEKRRFLKWYEAENGKPGEPGGKDGG